jgi:hypothetical protein
VRDFRCFPRLFPDDNSFYGSPLAISRRGHGKRKCNVASTTEVAVAERISAKEESSDREHRYAVRILRMARGANKRHGRLVRRFSHSRARFVVLISPPVFARETCTREAGRSSGHAGRGNVSYAKSWPTHRKIGGEEWRVKGRRVNRAL